MKLYVAGPMTGLPEFNYPAFRTAAAQLRFLGHDVEDPSTNTNSTPDDYHGWLRAGLSQLIQCDGVALLPGWETSGGARLEVNVGATLGLRVAPLQEWINEGTVGQTRRTSGEWVLLLGLDILDPDGWDRQNFNQSWTEPITRDEFMARARRSTVDMKRYDELAAEATA